jgi:hypothetical protein
MFPDIEVKHHRQETGLCDYGPTLRTENDGQVDGFIVPRGRTFRANM